MNIKRVFLATLAMLALSLGTTLSASAQTRSLILYYSQSHTTQTVAEELQRLTGADIEPVDVTQPYDGDYKQTIDRCKEEMARGFVPTLQPLKANVEQYDTVYIGYPIWFGTYAPPVAALLQTVCFDGKTVVPFCTFGSGGLNESVSHVRKALPKANVTEGFGIRQARVGKAGTELQRFLVSIGARQGTLPTLPDFSAQKRPTKAEKQIFEDACGSYPMPLGKPETVAHRQTADGTEYLFVVRQQRPDGQTMKAKIYVVDSNNADEKPEFTIVVR